MKTGNNTAAVATAIGQEQAAASNTNCNRIVVAVIAVQRKLLKLRRLLIQALPVMERYTLHAVPRIAASLRITCSSSGTHYMQQQRYTLHAAAALHTTCSSSVTHYMQQQRYTLHAAAALHTACSSSAAHCMQQQRCTLHAAR